MREFKVVVKGESCLIEANDRYHAAAPCVRQYLETHPEYTFTSLMQIVSARLTKPERTGRKAKNDGRT